MYPTHLCINYETLQFTSGFCANLRFFAHFARSEKSSSFFPSFRSTKKFCFFGSFSAISFACKCRIWSKPTKIRQNVPKYRVFRNSRAIIYDFFLQKKEAKNKIGLFLKKEIEFRFVF